MPRPVFSRHILPFLAVVAIVVAGMMVFWSQPERTLAEPPRQPAIAPTGAAVVAGAGVVEPASELIAIGAEVPGIVERVAVGVGDRVAARALLFTVDSRAARAGVEEAEARVARLRQSVAAAETALASARQQAALYANGGDPRAFSQQEVITRRGAAADARAQRGVAQAQLREALAELATARTTLARHSVRSPIAATVLQVRARAGQFAPAAAATGSDAPVTIGVTDPLHVRIDIDENEIERLAIGRPATISPRGAATHRVAVRFVRAEPLIVPKRSLTNASTERVDVRVLQLIYALPSGANGYFVGQQIDGFVPARVAR